MTTEDVRNIMFHWLFDVVSKPGYYIISYLTEKKDHVEDVYFYAEDKRNLIEKWREFAASHGVGKDNVSWVEFIY